jgi:hypothetical protein
MNIGFVNIYPYRPHGFHAAYLEYLLKLLGHSTFFLECGGSLDMCTAKLFRMNGTISCCKCQIGRVSKYSNNEVVTINCKIPKNRINKEYVKNRLQSSVLAFQREEKNFDYSTNPKLADYVNQLEKNYLKTYYSTLDLIEKKKLQGLVVFNGRLDMTRAAIDAAKFAKINFLTHDRPSMGHGVQINVNQDIIGLNDRARMNLEFDDKPLTNFQAKLAAIEISKRFLGKNFLEWKMNKTTKKIVEWPTSTKNKKILIVPSSIFERVTHEDWKTPWTLATEGFDLFLKSIGIKNDQVVVRFHPQWAQKKGNVTGESSHDLYLKWCKKNSYHFIDSHEKISTLDLIDKCDVLLINCSTAGVEAGSLGKKIINIGPSGYDGCGFFKSLKTLEEIQDFKGFENWMSQEEIIRKTLRYIYTALARYPQYFNHVRGISTTECIAFEGGNPERLERIIKIGKIVADDDIIGSVDEEREIIYLIKNRAWEDIFKFSDDIKFDKNIKLNISRSFPFNIIDYTRNYLKRGDL